ncbi:MAG TPA: YdeI/OmpD-associated family protein [Chthoniobacterales bacterium]|nr:YdeI/OmpD-associated family protein [Chthoniobacterales bacterium]
MTKSKTNSPIFFATSDDFRAWLEKYHQITTEQWVGFHRKSSGHASITWPEAVDEALCFGWIDGLRKTIDARKYKIRFTPRRPSSIWSAINSARIRELIREGRVRLAGRTAFQKRTAAKSHVYSYENRKAAKLSSAQTKLFRVETAAWKFFQRQPKSYRQTAIWWVVSAKRSPTRENRLQRLIASSKDGRRLWG